MIISSSNDYLAAVQERQRLEGLLESGRQQFSGYGLELFERGLRSKFDRLTAEIDRYKFQAIQAPASFYYGNECDYVIRNMPVGRFAFSPERAVPMNVLNGYSVNVLHFSVGISAVQSAGAVQEFNFIGGNLLDRPSFKIAADSCTLATRDTQMMTRAFVNRAHSHFTPTFAGNEAMPAASAI